MDLAFAGPGIDEAFHLKIDPDQEFLERWGVVDNVTTQLSGEPYEGTTIDRDEPFVIRCSPSYSNHLSPASAVMRTAGS